MTVNIRKGQAAGLINLTPMIDVVFQLLLFFLVASRFADEEREFKVLLPHASEALPLTVRPREYVVNVDHAGHYYVQGRMLTPAVLEESLRQLGADNPSRQVVIIRADKHSEWEHVIYVMNACNRAKLFDYRVTTAATNKAS